MDTYEEYIWEPVLILGGKHEGRIAQCDDVCGTKASCCFGSFLVHLTCADVRLRNVRPATKSDLMQRYGELYGQIASFERRHLSDFEQLDLFYEFYYITDILMKRWQVAQQTAKKGNGKSVFISHSSVDKLAAKWISVDLANKGHRPWLDEWEIKTGESTHPK